MLVPESKFATTIGTWLKPDTRSHDNRLLDISVSVLLTVAKEDVVLKH